MFEFISRYFWLIAIVFTVVQHLPLIRSNEGELASDPIKAREERTLKRLYALGTVLPWMILGAGMLTGSAPTVWYIFRPQDGNPFVVAFFGVTFGMSLVMAYWILFADGAKKVVEYRLMSLNISGTTKQLSPLILKLVAGIGPFFILFWIYMAMQMNIPIQK